MTLEQKLEALLFYYGEPVALKTLADLVGESAEEVEHAVSELSVSLKGHGIQLIRKDDEILLGTHPDTSDLIEKARKEELSREIGKAGIETLAIILYRAPITRAEIDYIRGVNSAFILRNLLIRGLIERIPNPKDQRSYVYKPTFDLLAYLGVTSLEELPEYTTIQGELEAFMSSTEEENKA